MARVVFDQVNIVVRDMVAALAFYKLAGLDVRDDPHHAEAKTESLNVGLEFDSHALARAYNQGFAAERANVIIGLKLAARDAVDDSYARLIAAGHQGLQAPFDAFWGARYAIVEDPDGNPVGLMSPVDPSRRSAPPALWGA